MHDALVDLGELGALVVELDLHPTHLLGLVTQAAVELDAVLLRTLEMAICLRGKGA